MKTFCEIFSFYLLPCTRFKWLINIPKFMGCIRKALMPISRESILEQSRAYVLPIFLRK